MARGNFKWESKNINDRKKQPILPFIGYSYPIKSLKVKTTLHVSNFFKTISGGIKYAGIFFSVTNDFFFTKIRILYCLFHHRFFSSDLSCNFVIKFNLVLFMNSGSNNDNELTFIEANIIFQNMCYELMHVNLLTLCPTHDRQSSYVSQYC